MNVENMRIAIQFFRELQEGKVSVNNSSLVAYPNPNGGTGLWNMETWGQSVKGPNFKNSVLSSLYGAEEEDKFLEVTDWMTEHGCGTANCALGWIALSKRFPNAKFLTDSEGSLKCFYLDSKTMAPSEFAEELFGIDSRIYWFLFLDITYRDPKQIADTMENLVESYLKGTLSIEIRNHESLDHYRAE